MLRINTKYFSFNLAVLVLFIVDRLLKNWFLKNPAEIQNFSFLQDFLFGLNFHFEKNFGVAFGIQLPQLFLVILVITVIVILVGMLIKSYKNKDLFLVFSLTLIIVGAVSNLIDRLRYGFVIDYIGVPWFTVFNLADVMITCGVGILLIGILFSKKLGRNLA